MSRPVLAIDPGPSESAFCEYLRGTATHINAGKLANEELLRQLHRERNRRADDPLLAVEMIASYGMAVGKEVFHTCVWIGRFVEAWGGDFVLVPRLDCKLHLCRDSRAKDPNIRQALIDRLGAPGTKKNPGATYGLAGDMWSALAVAVTVFEGGVR